MRDHLPRSDIATPFFPEYLSADGHQMRKMDDAVANRLRDGDPTLGWAGDSRLCLYLSASRTDPRWCLVRWCENREWAVLLTRPAVAGNAMNAIGQMIGFLVSHDPRRGVHVAQVVSERNEKAQEAVDRTLESWVEEEGGPRLTRQLLSAMDR